MNQPCGHDLKHLTSGGCNVCNGGVYYKFITNETEVLDSLDRLHSTLKDILDVLKGGSK